MENNKPLTRKERLKGHFEKHKFIYGYATGAAIAIVGAVIGDNINQKETNKRWNNAWDNAEDYYDNLEPDEDKTVLMSRDLKFYAYISDNK